MTIFSTDDRYAITEDIRSGEIVLRNWYDEGKTVYDDYDGWTVESTHEEFFSIHPDDPNSAKCDVTWTEKFSRGEWEVSSRTQTVVTSTPEHFILEAKLEAREETQVAHEQAWKRSFKRRFV